MAEKLPKGATPTGDSSGKKGASVRVRAADDKNVAHDLGELKDASTGRSRTKRKKGRDAERPRKD